MDDPEVTMLDEIATSRDVLGGADRCPLWIDR